MSALIEVEDLRLDLPTSAGLLHAVRGAGFTVEPGETFCIVGESGCGKSMTALAVMGLLPRGAQVSAARLRFQGRDLLPMPPVERSRLRGRHIGMIFQEPMTALNPVLTIGDQLTEVYLRHGLGGRSEARARAGALLDRVGVRPVDQRLRQYPHQMSGGLRQRVMIAMALMCRPALLLADEPTTALDVTTQVQILALLQELQRELGMALVLITHDLGVVAHVADRMAVMYAGEVVESGPMPAVLTRPSHPYTQALLRCLPMRGDRDRPLAAIPGVVPALYGEVSGCAFRNRCGHALPVCAGPVPWREAGGDHRFLCHLGEPP